MNSDDTEGTYPPEIVKSKRRLGLRCEAMLILGFAWMLIGLGVLSNASQPPDGMVFLLIPKGIRGAVWLATGLAAVVAGLRSQQTSRALTGLIIMPIVRAASYIWSWILFEFPGHTTGEYQNGWYQACFYIVMIAVVVFVQHVPPGVMRVGFKTRDLPDPRGDNDDVKE